MYSWMIVFLLSVGSQLLLSRTAQSTDVASLKIAAFNVQIFGVSKLSQAPVVENLVKIIRRYDILLFQEIRDSQQTAIFTLVNDINKGISDKYDVIVSKRLGRSNSKEQYAYIYRTSCVTLVRSYDYPDTSDVFEREPFVALFKWRSMEFFTVGVHTSPRTAESEISHLVDVYDHAKYQFGINDAILLGDFNAGCSYVTNQEWPRIKLATDKRFYWLITDDVDTTTGNSYCPYDRFVVAGDILLKSVIPNSARAFNYSAAYNLDESLALDVSDHYPVELILEPSFSSPSMHDKKSLSVHHPSSGQFSKSDIFAMRRAALALTTFTAKTLYTSSGAINSITVGILATGHQHMESSLKQLAFAFHNFVASSQVDTILQRSAELSTYRILASGNGRYQTLRDFYVSLTEKYDVQLKCELEDLSCYVQVELTEL